MGSPCNEERAAEQLLTRFAGRRDAFVHWTGRRYLTVHAALSASVVLAALRQRVPIGAYFLTPDSTSHVAALDLDRPDGWDLGCRIGSALWTLGVPAYVERSRDGRAHLWIVVARDPANRVGDLPGIVLRSALRASLALVDLAGAAGIELRPGSDRLGRPDGLGHALRLPTMAHKNTGERHPLCDARSGAPLGPTLGKMLAAVELAPQAALLELAEMCPPPAPTRTDAGRPRAGRGRQPIERFKASMGVCEVLRREFGAELAVPGRTIRCPCHEDRRPSLSISRDDSRVWCHAPHCVLSADGRGEDAYGLWLRGKAQAR